MANKNIRYCGECRWLDMSHTVSWGGKYHCPKEKCDRYKNDDATRCSSREKYENRTWSRSGWYITTLIFNLLGDDPNMSKTYLYLYYLKDNYLDLNPEFNSFIKDYNDIAPDICTKIMEEENPSAWARDIMDRFLFFCAKDVSEGNFYDATLIYMNMFEELKDHFKLDIVKPKVLKRVRVKNQTNEEDNYF